MRRARGLASAGLSAALAAVALAAASLTACTPTTAPSVDLDAAYAWANTEFELIADDDTLTRAVIHADAEQPQPGEGRSEWGFTFPQLATVTGLRVRCFGPGTAKVDVHVSHDSTTTVIDGDVDCDRADHLLTPESPLHAVTSLVIPTARAGADTALVVAVEGSMPTADTWAGHFDHDATESATEMALQYWGSFGATDQVVVIENRDLTLPAGPHTARVLCAGASAVRFTAAELKLTADGEHVPADEVLGVDVDCDTGEYLTFRTADEGTAFTLDSDGAPGAYLLQIDPDEAVLAP